MAEFNPCAVTRDKIDDRCLRCLHLRQMHDDKGCVLCYLREAGGQKHWMKGDLHGKSEKPPVEGGEESAHADT
jgi:hypothetical protein